MVYLLGVLLVSIVWGAVAGVATSLASALAFNFFHLPPTGRLHDRRRREPGRPGVFLVAAVVASSLAEAARPRAGGGCAPAARPSSRPSWRACCSAPRDLPAALGPAAQRIAQAFGLASCRLVLEAVGGDERSAAIPLERDGERLGTLLVPRDARGRPCGAVRPALEALLAAALERDALTREVVETARAAALGRDQDRGAARRLARPALAA